jgi:RHS repeat-associated protein
MRTGSGSANSGVKWLLGDHLGSTSLTANYDGASPVTQLYKPWGEVRYSSGSLPTKYTYTGQYSNMSDFGLMFYNARWYDPVLGRFAQADSIVPQPFFPQDYDRYGYVYNNPANNIDPSGHMGEPEWMELLGGDVWEALKDGLSVEKLALLLSDDFTYGNILGLQFEGDDTLYYFMISLDEDGNFTLWDINNHIAYSDLDAITLIIKATAWALFRRSDPNSLDFESYEPSVCDGCDFALFDTPVMDMSDQDGQDVQLTLAVDINWWNSMLGWGAMVWGTAQSLFGVYQLIGGLAFFVVPEPTLTKGASIILLLKGSANVGAGLFSAWSGYSQVANGGWLGSAIPIVSNK